MNQNQERWIAEIRAAVAQVLRNARDESLDIEAEQADRQDLEVLLEEGPLGG